MNISIHYYLKVKYEYPDEPTSVHHVLRVFFLLLELRSGDRNTDTLQ